MKKYCIYLMILGASYTLCAQQILQVRMATVCNGEATYQYKNININTDNQVLQTLLALKNKKRPSIFFKQGSKRIAFTGQDSIATLKSKGFVMGNAASSDTLSVTCVISSKNNKPLTIKCYNCIPRIAK